MTVGDLQRHLLDLSRFLEAAGAKKEIASDLVAIEQGLSPFRDVPLKTFADFLKRAEAFSRGEVPVTPPKRKKPRPARAIEPAIVVDDFAARLRVFYDGVTDESVTQERVEAELRPLQELNKPDLLVVANAMEIRGMGKKKVDEVREAIRRKVCTRKGVAQRASMVEPLPASAN